MLRFRSSIFFLFFAAAFFVPAALSADSNSTGSSQHRTLEIRVVDPQSAAVSGAQISIFRAGDSNPVAVRLTASDGAATFTIENVPSGSVSNLQARVLAPGFAVETVDIPDESLFTIALHIAPASETVVVTATRTPVPADLAGASVDTLSGSQLTTMQPAAASDALRFLPGAIINASGQRGALSSLFVRGGESTYNKVIVDGVAIDNPGLTFDFGVLPLTEADRLEFVRGAQSTLYGSDAMTSVVQVWTRNGSTTNPELAFGADGGNFGTANGYASLSGIFRHFDYNFFADQFNTNGQGINNQYSNSLQGANVGLAITDQIALRIRVRHANSYSGVPGEWDFNGDPVLAPDPSEWSHQNNLLGSVELAINSHGWQHRLTGFDSLYRYNDTNLNSNDNSYDSFPDSYTTHDNRAGFEYQGDYSERPWTHSTFGYRLENETGFVNDQDFPPEASGQRLQQDAYFQQQATLGRLNVIVGGRFVHNSAYGNTGVPRVALTLLALRGGNVLSGTRLRFSYATGFMTPALYEVYGEPGYYEIPNPNLLPERTRAFEAGIEQKLFAGRWVASATYFNNLFHDQIDAIPNPTGEYQFFNLNRSFAQGAEFQLQGKIRSRLLLNVAYTYTSTEVLDSSDAYPYAPGDPLLRRPKHAGTTLLTYLGNHWGANLSGSFVGRRPDDAFLFTPPNFTYAAGYALVNLGGWYAINSHITAYANLDNALNRHYNEVVGYPAMTANFRAGFRFRIGGDR